MRVTVKPALFGVMIVGLGLLLPLRFDAEKVLSVNEACAEGDYCCPELGAFCGELEDWKAHNYTSGNGRCE